MAVPLLGRPTVRCAWVGVLLLAAGCAGGQPALTGGDPEAANPTPAGTAAVATDEQPPDVAVDACSLLTNDEVEAALGAAVTPATENVPPFFGCTWDLGDFSGLSLSVIVYDDAEEAGAGYQMAIDINDYPELSGLGDRAYDARPISDVTVLEGRYELGVDIFGTDMEAADEFAQAQLLAATALTRLP